jgi:hypothetical protein
MLLQQCSSGGGNKSSDFFRNLRDALVSANIPFSALNNEKLKSFLEVNCGSIPDESTLRKNYLSKCYNSILEMIRNKVHGKKIFVSIDETCDTEAEEITEKYECCPHYITLWTVTQYLQSCNIPLYSKALPIQQLSEHTS